MKKKKMSKEMKLVTENLGLTMGIGVGTSVVGKLSGSLPSGTSSKNLMAGMDMMSNLPLINVSKGLINSMSGFGKTTKKRKRKK